jgi:SDR family mycofactocin-dependent oxidoreductase
MTLFSGKTVLISGAARGQGRSHAVGFGRQGANVVAFDICAPMESAGADVSTIDDLNETARQVEAAGGTVMTRVADVRDAGAVSAVVEESVARFGGLDIVIANAAIVGSSGPSWLMDEQVFLDVIDVDLIGVWHTVRAGVLSMLSSGTRGCVIVTGSGASVKGLANLLPYVVAKHGLVGMVRTMARELAPHGIRVNAVLPGNVNTPMFNNDKTRKLFVPEQADPDNDLFLSRAGATIPMGVPWVESQDITEAMFYLASEAARYVTGALLPVDGGSGIP